MDADYPAAHSMDTEWFAVDDCGHVALFSSGEAGAVPSEACVAGGPEGGDEEVLPGIRQAAPPSEVLHEPESADPSGDPRAASHSEAFPEKDQEGILMFLASEEPVAAELASGAAKRLRAASGVAVYWKNLPAAVAKRLHVAGACLACGWHFESDPEDDEDFPPAGTFGCFSYGHTTDNWISGPYGRVGQPSKPVLAKDLPPDLRAKLSRARFKGLCFQKTKLIQPVDHLPCESWDSAYLTVDGKEARPFPGREEEYRAAYKDLGEGDDRIRWVPPPGGPVPKAPSGAPPPPAKSGGLGGFLRRLFGRE